MGKLTAKLQAGLHTLGQEFDTETPNIFWYGVLARRGYEWDGEAWRKTSGLPELSEHLQLRIMGTDTDIAMLAPLIAQFLEAGGYRVECSRIVKNHRDAGARQYLDFE